MATQLVRRHPTNALLHPLLYLVSWQLYQASQVLDVELPCGCGLQVDSRDGVGRYLYLLGVWEPAITAFIAGELREGDVFVDVGANLGYYTLMMSHVVGPTGAVLAIEPGSSNYDMLTHNVDANRLNNVSTIPAAVAGLGVDEVTMHIGGPLNRGGTHGRKVFSADEGETEVVPSVAISSVLSRAMSLGAIRVMKIDVEGMELAILRELLHLVPTLPNDLSIVVEVTPQWYEGGADELEEVLQAFEAAGFKIGQLFNEYAITRHSPRSIPPMTRPERPLASQADLVMVRR